MITAKYAKPYEPLGHGINSRAGIMSFFNAGSSAYVSDNGLTEAQRYFQTSRIAR